ncbi:MAG: ribbon-helix-helix protein, CopG family [Candidatus Brocadiia bacterium]
MRTIVDLPDDQIELLKQLSERTRLSRAELMRRAVGEYLQRRKPGPDERAFGIWRDAPRDGLDYQRGLRDEWGS